MVDSEEKETSIKMTEPHHSSNPHQAQLLERHEESTTQQTSNQDRENSFEQAKLEARRESNRRSARNARMRQTSIIESLRAENQFLRTELGKAFDRIDHLKLTLEQETQRALDHNRCLQLIVKSNMKKQQQPSHHHREPTTSRTCAGSTETRLSSLLQMAHTIDPPSLRPAASSFSQENQGFVNSDGSTDRSSRTLLPTSNEATITGSFPTRRTSYEQSSRTLLSLAHPDGSTGDSGSSNHYSAGGNGHDHAGSSYSTVDEQLEQIQRLENELKMLKRHAQR